MTENADQKTYWNESVGAKWVANQVRIDRLMEPVTKVLAETAAPLPGERVLDVGCGCGDLSLRIAERVGPSGKVLGIDLSRPMLAHASSRSVALDLNVRAPIAWLEADAMVYAFEPGYDLMVSRFGVMFFDDKLKAFTNLRQALRPGGRFTFLAWRGRAEIEWFQAPLEWVASVLPMPDSIDGAIGPCGLADEKATLALLAEAGFRDLAVEPVDCPLVIGETIEDALALLADTGPVAALMRESEADLRAEAHAQLRLNLASTANAAGRVELGGACWIYRGVS
jgi:SAM-dependent methyltransferase